MIQSSGQITWQGSIGSGLSADPAPLADGKMVVGSGDDTVKTVIDVYIEPITGALVTETDFKVKGCQLQLIASSDSDALALLYEEAGGDGALVLNDETGTQRAFLGIENASGDAALVCSAAKNLRLGRSTSAPAVTISDKLKLAEVAAAAAGDVGMDADGRPMIFSAAGFDERGIGIAAASRRVASAKDVCDYFYDSGPKTISTSALTVIATISGPASGKMYGIDAQLIGKLQDETSGEHLVRRIIAVNNAGTITVTQGTNSGVSGTLGDAFGVQVNGANLEFYIDPGDATARDYRYIARVWELV